MMMEARETVCDRSIGMAIQGIREHMVRLGYERRYRRRFDRTWRKFSEFAAHRGIDTLSVDLTEAFLLHGGVGSSNTAGVPESEQQHRMRAMRYLLEFEQHGCFQRRRSGADVCLPDALAPVLERFVRFCIEDLRVSSRTIRVRRRRVATFLMFLASHGALDVRSIGVESVSGFLSSLGHLMPRTLATVVSDLRVFLRFLAMEGMAPPTLVECIPRIRACKDQRIPDVWRPEDVAALLGAIDRGSPIGKRDYAIVLLAARLGMRVSDIRDLRLEDLHWEEARIERVQAKTGVPIVLPLSEEIGEALIAYLRDGRPTTARREVFLRHLAPFEPFGSDDNLHHIVTSYRRRAGIELPRHSQKGLHSLRHTVATRLLEAGVALETISGVMGHISPESTRIYTKVDITGLRSAALDLGEVRHE